MHERGRRRNVAYQLHLLVSDPTSADMDSLQQLSSILDSSIRRVIIRSIGRSMCFTENGLGLQRGVHMRYWWLQYCPLSFA